MKKQVAVIALAVVGIAASQVSAQQDPQPRPPKTYPGQHNSPNPHPRTSRAQEHNANKLPFGTSEWWQQMLREDRVRN